MERSGGVQVSSAGATGEESTRLEFEEGLVEAKRMADALARRVGAATLGVRRHRVDRNGVVGCARDWGKEMPRVGFGRIENWSRGVSDAGFVDRRCLLRINGDVPPGRGGVGEAGDWP